jgi:hypothetical protein
MYIGYLILLNKYKTLNYLFTKPSCNRNDEIDLIISIHENNKSPGLDFFLFRSISRFI